MKSLLLALGLLLLVPTSTPADGVDGVPQNPERCTTRNPRNIAVFMIHYRGSSRRAYIDHPGFKTYVGKVMASGASPAYKPIAVLKAMALTIKQRAHWFICHPQRGYTWRGQHYDIHNGSARKALRGRADSGQLYKPSAKVHSRIKRAVNEIWHLRLVRHNGNQGKPQWSGDGGRCLAVTTGNRLLDDGATDCAKRGRGWRWIIAKYLSSLEVRHVALVR
jgi:hypothetical protein